MTSQPKYMVSTIHWLNADDAEAYAIAHDIGYVRIIKEDDGTFTVVRLSDTPVQPGQAAYIGRQSAP
jgi:hypothetical protein